MALQRSANGRFLKGWDPAWGGSLELFPVEAGEEVGPPSVKRFAKVSATWGQIVFFEVRLQLISNGFESYCHSGATRKKLPFC